ncbi:NeuD/PglB/VioB family sugar acetyltransferase [Synechococcus sp. MW101C3]|uniref:NeuD/PglB/VioB family sugar acetyltransferase n=1 Tax=Synechococcus sp. MW101C3 TaxID=210768 RepID=UPI00130365C6|nr:NeuD/PglB/VioB family sugar acetyltransferase [Synechococcus sp. MW101C3]
MSEVPLLLFGAGGHAHALLAVLERHAGFTPVGLIDSFQTPGTLAHGIPVLGGESDLPQLCQSHGVHHLLVAIGANLQRQAITRRLAACLPDVMFPALIDPTAVVAADAHLGAGAVVMAQAHVGAGCELGEGVLVNTRASLDHDSRLDAFASLAPGVIAGGRVWIGERSAIGLGAMLRNDIGIGADTVVGAGSLVLGDLAAGVMAYGAPALVIRSRQPDEPYL